MKRRIMVAIPAYNCRNQIARVLQQFTPAIAPLFAEVVVVDNQSKDGTAAAATEQFARSKLVPMFLLRNRENYNLGGTHKVAFQRCLEKNYDGVVILHGDDQGQISDFSDLHDDVEKTNAACILGARFQPGSRTSGYSAFRIWGNHVFNAIYTLCVGKRVYDMGSGLNYYSAELIRSALHMRMPDDLTFNNCMLLATYAAGEKVHFKPISWREEDQVSNARLVTQSRKLLAYLATYVLNRKELLTNDYRTVKRDSYPSDEVADNLDVLETKP